jgi:hypothetical protein
MFIKRQGDTSEVMSYSKKIRTKFGKLGASTEVYYD